MDNLTLRSGWGEMGLAMQMLTYLPLPKLIHVRPASSRHALRLLFMILLAISVGSAGAQTGHVINGTSVPARIGATVGQDGSVYYFSQSATNQLLKVTPSGGGAYTQSVLLNSAASATGNVAIDSGGAIYFISSGSVVKETPASGNTYTESIISVATLTSGLVVDASGNLYGTTSSGIAKLTPSGTTYTATAVVTGLTSPSSVAVDSSGNLYVIDTANSQLLEEKPSGAGYTQSVLATGLLAPKDVIVDGRGNLYYTDLRHIYKAVSSGSGFSFRLYGYFDSSAMPGDPTLSWLAIDPTGTLLYVEGSSAGLLVYPTSSVDPPNIQFGAIAVGNHSTQTLTYTFAEAVTLGSYKVVTQGATGFDYTDAGGGTCAAGTSYTAGASCTVVVTFTPRNAGLRSGAVAFVDGSGAAIGNAPLSGSGTAPQVAFAYATGTAVVPTNSSFSGIAVDGNGNVYLTDDINKQVLKETPNGAGAYTQTVIATGLQGPKAIAVDGAGDLYVTDVIDQITMNGTGSVLKLTPQSSGSYTQTTVATNLNFPTGVAVDTNGNVYVIDYPALIKLTLLPGDQFAQTNLNYSAGGTGIAVDGSGDIFIGANGNGVAEFIPGPTANYTTVAVGTSTLIPNGNVAVDGAGNLYVAGVGAGDEQQVIRLKVNADETSSMSFTSGAGIIAVDGSGSVYAVGNNISLIGSTVAGVYKLDQATPPTVDLFGAAVGTTSDVSDPIYFANIGNAPLTFSVPASGNNPVVSTNFLLDTTFSTQDACPDLTPGSSPSTLAPGDQCRYFVDFAPTVSGMLTGTLTASDDNLNVANATQIIHLFGNATGGTPATPTLSPGSFDFGTNTIGSASAAEVFTLSNPTATALAISGISFTGTGAAQFAQTNNCGSSLAASGSCSISVIFTAAAAVSYSATLSVADDAGNSPQTASLTGAGAAAAAPQAVPSPTSLAFGSVTVGTASAAKTITLSNPGTAPLDLSGITVTGTNAALFTETDNCDDGLNAGASCTITVIYSPTAVENDSAAITITDNAANSPQSVALTGAGAAAPVADFSISAAPGSQSITAGSAATYQLTVAPQNGFTSAVTFTASGLPPGASVSFSPASVTPDGTAATSVMTITTVAQTAAQSRATPFWRVVPTTFAAILLMPVFRRRFRKQGRLLRARAAELGLSLLVLTLAGFSVMGCSGGFALPGPASTTYTVAVTGTSGQIAHSTTVTLTVK